jgi:hypothetical protein
MPYLIIYYSDNKFLDEYKLNLISDKIHDILKLKKYWKLDCKPNIINSNELIDYGEYILDIVSNYKKEFFKFNILSLLSSNKPSDFNYILVIKLLFNQSHKLLFDYINNYQKNSFYSVSYKTSFNELRIDDDIQDINFNQNFDTFFEELYILNIALSNYLENPLYYNKDLDHYMHQNDLNELKHFGYFNLKYGESDKYGVWSDFSYYINLDVD